jgi:N-acetylated-alpha-linked acidic dipeptidase
MDGVPSLRDLLLDATAAVTDVRTGKTLRELWTEKRRVSWAAAAPVEFYDPLWATPAVEPVVNGNGASRPPAGTSLSATQKPAGRFSPQLNPLGSGSDYTAFLDHLGVPSVDVGFGGRYGVYHSVYDDFYWMEKFCDPEFLTHATAARLYTAIAMRAAGAEVLPMKFTAYGEALRDYLDDLRRTVERRSRAATPGQSPPPMAFEGLPALVQSVKKFQTTAALVDAATEELTARDGLDAERLSRVNDTVQRVERAFLMPEGLPGRPWFKHAVYAPGLTTGYSSWPLPGVRQAVLENNAELLAAQVPLLVARIDAVTEALNAVLAASRTALSAPAAAAGPAAAGAATGSTAGAGAGAAAATAPGLLRNVPTPPAPRARGEAATPKTETPKTETPKTETPAPAPARRTGTTDASKAERDR